ncbi:hypothetical protein C8Q72DRAFT_808649 [Fomitopsis betulina]|nr:hypothetical protein C8Q72DRAFT_808649 [Fomitopsis betulina]
MSHAPNRAAGPSHESREEKRPLVSTSGGRIPAQVDIKRMRYIDVFRAALTKRAAFSNDPIFKYITETPDDWHPRLSHFVDFLVYILGFLISVFTGNAWVIEGGYAYITFAVPGQNPTVSERVIGLVIKLLRKSTRTGKQKRLLAETMSKQNAAIEACLGDQVESMFAVHDLAAHPTRQGRGYGRALLTVANANADELGLASWLPISNLKNTAFYEGGGYKTVREFTVGDDNPTWTGLPVILRIMYRQPRNLTKVLETKGD